MEEEQIKINMTEILPIKAWRYNPQLKPQIEELTSPLFDVVSTKQRESLYKNNYNSIHLVLPEGKNHAKDAKRILDSWKKEGVILQDIIPGIYVYYQRFSIPDKNREYCRKGFICHVKVEDWDKKVVIRHENTIAHAVQDRLEILRDTCFQPSPTHGLYDDPEFLLEKYMDESVSDPLYDFEDYQGVRHTLGVIHDVKIIRQFHQSIRDKPIILADGHHRYEGAVAYRKEREAGNPHHNGHEMYNYHMMYLTNACSKGLKILPTHRLFHNLHLTENSIIDKLSTCFTIKVVADPQEIGELIINKPWAFGLVFKNSAYKIRLKPGCMQLADRPLPHVVQKLDLEVLHYFFIEKVLGIPREKQRFSDNITYERNINRCHYKVSSGEADFAIITRGVTMKEVMEVAASGYTMPQKSTFFYPKAISGLVFGSIEADEVEFPYEMFL